MAKARETTITVRVQTKGGKFLGDDIGGALVTIRDGQTGEILASGVTRGDSGSIVSGYSADASQRAIVTPGSTPRSPPSRGPSRPTGPAAGVSRALDPPRRPPLGSGPVEIARPCTQEDPWDLALVLRSCSLSPSYLRVAPPPLPQAPLWPATGPP